MHGVECPTCFNKYPVDEILQHADLCASSIIDSDINSSNIGQEDYKLDQIAMNAGMMTRLICTLINR